MFEMVPVIGKCAAKKIIKNGFLVRRLFVHIFLSEGAVDVERGRISAARWVGNRRVAQTKWERWMKRRQKTREKEDRSKDTAVKAGRANFFQKVAGQRFRLSVDFNLLRNGWLVAAQAWG